MDWLIDKWQMDWLIDRWGWVKKVTAVTSKREVLLRDGKEFVAEGMVVIEEGMVVIEEWREQTSMEVRLHNWIANNQV